MNGWMGSILRVDLSHGEIKRESLNPELARMYVGGRGLATKFLYDELDIFCDPLGPDNLLIFINGPVSMTLGLSSGRNMVVTRSPLTGTICSSNAGGYFPGAFKTAGYDAIIIKGRAETPVYLASSLEVEEVTGEYFAKRKAGRSSKTSYDEQLQRELWERTIEILEITSIHQVAQ